MEPKKLKLVKDEVKELQKIIAAFITEKSNETTTILDAYIIESVRTLKHRLDKANLKIEFTENLKTVQLTLNSIDLITLSIIANYVDENELANNTGILNRIIMDLPVEVINIIEETNKLVLANG